MALDGSAAFRPTERFRYRAAKSTGEIVRGSLLAVDLDSAHRRLADVGLSTLDVTPSRWQGWRRPVKRQDLAALFLNLAILTESGVPFERALLASELLVGSDLQESLAEIRRMLREGAGVAEAMSSVAGVFPRSVLGAIEAGQRGSRLPDACGAVADQLQADARLQAEVRSALTYPLVILVVGLTSVVVMGAIVVPRFAAILADLGGDLPPATRALLAASSLLTTWGWAFGLGAGATLAVGVRWLRLPSMRRKFDGLLLQMPIVGPLRLGFSSARTCRALGGMLSTGMSLLPALDAAREAAGDEEVARRFDEVRHRVRRGASLHSSLVAESALAPLALQLVGVGESSGQLAHLTQRAGDVVGEHAQRSLRTLVSLLEPLLVVALGVLVALVAAALLQAVYSVRPI